MLVVVWACLTGVLIAAGKAVVHSATLTGFDRHATAWAVHHRSPALDELMRAVTWAGSWVALAATGAVILALAVRRRLPGLAVALAVVAWAGEAGGVSLAKQVVHRSRPPERIWLTNAHGWSWPSGHTAVAVLVFATLATLVTYLFDSRHYRALAWASALLAVVAVGYSRVELGVHWTSDVLGSFVFVAMWLVAVAAALRMAVRRRDRRAGRGSRQVARNGRD